MASKFGGIPVNEEPTRKSRFGGSVVDDVVQPEQTQRAATEYDPLAGLKRGAGLITRAVAPYAAAAGTGAAIGAPLGGVGAIPGAIAGLGAYGFAQLADALVQGGAGQQEIENLMARAGLPEPETAIERVSQAGIRGMVGGAGSAATSQQLAQALAQRAQQTNSPLSTTGRVMQQMGARPDVQTIAGGTAAATAQGAREFGAPELLATGLGMMTGAAPYASVSGLQRRAQAVADIIKNRRPTLDATASAAPKATAGVAPAAAPSRIDESQFPTSSAVRRMNVQRLEKEGVLVSPGQRSGAPLSQTMESVMAYLPSSAGQSAKFTDLQQRSFTKALLRRAGIDSDIATEDVLRAAQQRFNDVYTDLEQNTVLRGGSERLFNKLADIESEYGKGFSGQMRRTFMVMRDDLLKWAAGDPKAQQTFQRLQEQLSTEIGGAARSPAEGSQRYKQALIGMKKALFDLVEEQSSPEIAKRWKDANRQYAIFKTIEESMLDASQKTINTGFINPRVIASLEKRYMPDEWTRGDPNIDSFTRLVKAGAGIIPDPIPNSGTAQRMFAQDILTGGGQMIGWTGGGPWWQRVGQAVKGGAGTAASVTAVDPVAGLVVPNLVSRTWYRQPQADVSTIVPSATESAKQRQKTQAERYAEALRRRAQ